MVIAKDAGTDKSKCHAGNGARFRRPSPVQPCKKRYGKSRQHHADSHPDEPCKHLRRVKCKPECSCCCQNDGDLTHYQDFPVTCTRFEDVPVNIPGEHCANGQQETVGRGHHCRKDNHREDPPDKNVWGGVLDTVHEGIVLRIAHRGKRKLPFLNKCTCGEAREFHEEHHDCIDYKGDQRRPLEVAVFLCCEYVIDDVRRTGKSYDEQKSKRYEEFRRAKGVSCVHR